MSCTQNPDTCTLNSRLTFKGGKSNYISTKSNVAFFFFVAFLVICLMAALHLKSLPSSEESQLEWTHWGPRIFCCHWLLKLQLFCICRRRKWARKGKKSLDSVFGAVSKHRLWGVLCEIVHFILLLFNKDSDREFWKGKIDPNPHTKTRTNVTLFQPLMKRLLCHFTPYLTQFHVTSLQELSWYFIYFFVPFVSHYRLITLDSWRMASSNRGILLLTNTGSSPEDLFSSTLAMKET